MILDAERFVNEERPYWDELGRMLEEFDADSARKLNVNEAMRLNYLYRRAAADLVRARELPGEQQLHAHLQDLVSRAYGEIYESRKRSSWRLLGRWFTRTIPQTFRRRHRAFAMTMLLFSLGAAFGGGVIVFDYESKGTLLPFSHLQGDPSERVAWEESQRDDRMEGAKSTFAAQLMQNNIRVSIMALAFGMTYGLGTVIALFFNGAILGAVALDYMLAGETKFLIGWLLPHGSVEIPAILFASQGGLVLAGGLFGWGDSRTLRTRMRAIGPDLATLIGFVAILLVWAGIVESFFSQYHEPYLPYSLKIAFGAVQLTALVLYLLLAGRSKAKTA